jgi:hypothetical protein
MDQPRNDGQFADFFLDPALARVINALTNGAVAIPAPPRIDLLPVVTYRPPIAAPGTPPGPVADMLRLNTGVLPTPGGGNRLGLLGGDPAGFPNGRRVSDDVTDIALRLVVGGVLAAPFPGYAPGVNDRLGDGVNVNDLPYFIKFPYVAQASSGRDRRHVDPGELGGGGTPPDETLVFSGLGASPFAAPPAGAAAWRVRSPAISHIDGPFALPGASNPLGLPVAAPGASMPGATWAPPDSGCSFFHLHGTFQGHPDPASTACGHGGLEWGTF